MLSTKWKLAIRRMQAGLLASTFSSFPATMARAGESADDEAPDEIVATADLAPMTPPRTLTAKTLGGRQFWADVAFLHEWRIQQNVLTGHYRLLDGDDYRHAWGTREACRRKLDEIRVARNLAPMSGEAVILIHGLVRSSKSMGKLQRRLAQ
jgi:hypothetical protein